LPISLEEAWAFFSNPKNLEVITPPWLQFRILELDTEEMYTGQLITYRIRLAPMVWVPWITEIKNVKDREQFTDEQRVGPYGFWHHTHGFEANDEGVKITDLVRYHVGWGPIGSIAEAIYVNKSVSSIFDYRRQILAERFG